MIYLLPRGDLWLEPETGILNGACGAEGGGGDYSEDNHQTTKTKSSAGPYHDDGNGVCVLILMKTTLLERFFPQPIHLMMCLSDLSLALVDSCACLAWIVLWRSLPLDAPRCADPHFSVRRRSAGNAWQTRDQRLQAASAKQKVLLLPAKSAPHTYPATWMDR